MAKRLTMTEALRQAIADSGMTLLALEKTTGVQRRSIARFVRGDQSLRLDLADRLAEYLDIEVQYKGK